MYSFRFLIGLVGLVIFSGTSMAAFERSRNPAFGWEVEVIKGVDAIGKIKKRLVKGQYVGRALKSTYKTETCAVHLRTSPVKKKVKLVEVEIKQEGKKRGLKFVINSTDQIILNAREVGGLQEEMVLLNEEGEFVASLFFNIREGETEAANVTVEVPYGKKTRSTMCMID